MLEVPNKLRLHFVNGNVFPLEHALIDLGLDLAEEGLLVLHDSGHDMPGNVGGKYHLDPVDFLQNIVLDLPVLHVFGVFLDENLKILNIVDNKEQRGYLKDVLITVIQPPHHVVKLDLGIKTINHDLTIVHVHILNLPRVNPAPADKYLRVGVHCRDNLTDIVRPCQRSGLLTLLVQLVHPKTLPVLTRKLVEPHDVTHQLRYVHRLRYLEHDLALVQQVNLHEQLAVVQHLLL